MRRTLTSLAAVLLAVSAAPISGIVTAHAATVSATCATIATALSTASTGDVITLGGGVLCPGPYTIKTGSAITLQGATSSDGFDGMGTNVILSGLDNGRTTIRNLIFKNGKTVSGGGAINLDGDVFATITANTFLGNSGTAGGAIFISASTPGDGLTITNNLFGSPGLGNASTGVGGAVRAAVAGVTTISDNVFDSNTASSSGGGVFAATFGAGSRLDFSRNQLLNNSVTGPFGGAGGGAELQIAGNVTMNTNVFRNNSVAVGRRFNPGNLGGGVDLRQLNGGRTLTQSHNLFVGNSVASISDGSLAGAGFDFGGGGEFAQFTNVNSLDDVFNSNTVGDASVKTTPVGGGFAVQGFFGTKVTLTATNLVLTNNSTGQKGEGGGAYAGFSNGCGTPPCTAEIDLFDSTVAGNSVGAGGQGAGLNGNQTDTAKVVNSIVYGNTGTVKQIDGFGTISVNHTDSCSAAATAYLPTGAGNICVDPLLANVAGNNVHETAASPTKDAGDSGQVAAAVTSDYEGDPRIQGTRVDMGADEFEVAPTPTPTPALPKAGAAATHVPLVPAALVVLLSLVAPLVVRGAQRRRGARSRF